MTLGTAWAIRGQFGHEQGAAWAGAIGCLGLILLAKRADWYSKALKATLAGAIGWGLGGLMSYGVIVGYGRGDDFPNVFYGLVMLFVIGSIYGSVGGGLFGLVLEESDAKPVAWSTLLVEMVAIALVTYFFMIEEWEWLMTPPRSELWAACLGTAIALAWYQYRHGYHSALRIGIYSGLGAGFGFAFGNFLSVLGGVSGIQFNFWNVMEYSLGFFGGMGMAYGTLTANWQSADSPPTPHKHWFTAVALALFIPLVVWDQSFIAERLVKNLESLTTMDPGYLAHLTQLAAFLAIAGMGIFWVYYYNTSENARSLTYSRLSPFFIGHFALYIFCSLLITGAFLSTHRVEQYLYLINLLIIAIFMPKVNASQSTQRVASFHWSLVALAMMILLAGLAFLAISSHGEVKGAQVRF